MAARSRLERYALDSPEKRAWATYDWANSAFWTVVITAVFPTYYATVAEELGPQVAEGRFSIATAVALTLIACVAPLLGTIADYRASKKRFLALFAFLGAATSACMFFVFPGDWLFALILFGVANIGASGSVIFYDALLPHVARPDEVDRLSTSGFALGYLGGGLLLGLNLLWIKQPEWFGLPSGEGLSTEQATLRVRLAFLSVGVWWFAFTLPLLFRVPEPPAPAAGGGGPLLRVALSRLWETLRELRRYRQAFLFLVAFLIYNDGIMTIIRMAALYASSRDLPQSVVIGTVLAIQFIAIPFAILFGQLASRFGSKRLILAGLGVYCGITVLAFFMSTVTHFVALGVLVAMVQGGTQALSRSLFARLIPSSRSAEFFGFFSVGEKFAGILGPAAYGFLIYATGSSRLAILSTLGFFLVGGFLLTRVDLDEGIRTAHEADRLQST